ncbi:MAG: PP2C family protein-serine/threonine phosphatase [Spirochaetota bacterium]
MNNFFASRYRGSEIMTLLIIQYDKQTHCADYINAGHCPPLVIREGQVERNLFPDRAMILGADTDTQYHRSMIQLRSGDQIILFTDGIVEIQKDKSGNNIGDIFLIDVLTKNISESLEAKIDRIGWYLEKFPKNSIQDDITILGCAIE